jgi:hypothetical protein
MKSHAGVNRPFTFGRGLAVTRLSLDVRKTRLRCSPIKRTGRREETNEPLTLLALNPHRVSRDQPLCCRQFRRNEPGLGYPP